MGTPRGRRPTTANPVSKLLVRVHGQKYIISHVFAALRFLTQGGNSLEMAAGAGWLVDVKVRKAQWQTEGMRHDRGVG